MPASIFWGIAWRSSIVKSGTRQSTDISVVWSYGDGEVDALSRLDSSAALQEVRRGHPVSPPEQVNWVLGQRARVPRAVDALLSLHRSGCPLSLWSR